MGDAVGIIPGLKPDFSAPVDLLPGMVLCFSIQQCRRSGMVLSSIGILVIFPGVIPVATSTGGSVPGL
ncbi:MAG: hypothetical protein QNK37_09815 [Acidobacteriota bacterium]|nr:hypothetical protein [Acidobacteriota bacterium]